MNIRRVRSEEYDELGRITVEAYRGLSGGESLGHYEVELLDVAARDRDSEVFVALNDEGKLLGGVTYVPGAERAMSEFNDADAAGIRMLAVDPHSQGQGAGRSLVETCIERGRLQQRRRIILHSTPIMTTARAMYVRLGFRESPELDIWFNDVLDENGEPFHLVAYTLSL